MIPDRSRPSTLSISLFLGLVTVAAYAPLWRLGFVNMDDPLYVSGNPHVLAGLGWPGFVWALTTTSQANWHPLTWMSLMLDATIGGTDARIYHATNLALHVANTLLLFAVFGRMTGCRLKSAFVAALFAVHPLHVESVAWIAERKDVLSGVFWMLTLTAYARYAERPSRPAYAAVVAAFAFGLAAKPMLVSLPIVLMLLDFWPLARWGRIESRRLLLEKLPLFGLALASCVVTLVVQRPAMERMEGVSFGARAANASVSYVAYVRDLLWPRGLSIFYPYPHGMVWQPIAAAVVLAAMSALAIRAARRYPWLTVGWFWYVVALVPVIGLVQVGIQARADRYTYLPLIGLFVIVAWGVPELLMRVGSPDAARAALKMAAIAVVVSLGALTWVQVGVWRNGVDLFTHAIAVTGDNVLAQFNLSDALSAQGDDDGAMLHLREAVRIDPHFPDAHFNLASALIRQRKVDEAAVLCRQAAEFWPNNERTLVNLGIVELLRGNYAEAEARLTEALRRYPDSAVARHNLAVAQARLARSDPR